MQQNEYVAYMEVHLYNKCLNLPPLKPLPNNQQLSNNVYLKPPPNNQRLSNRNDGPEIEEGKSSVV